MRDLPFRGPALRSRASADTYAAGPWPPGTVHCEHFKAPEPPAGAATLAPGAFMVKIASSGNEMMLAFCGNCGTSLYSGKKDDPSVFNLRLGAVKQRAELTPKAQYWCRSAMPWAMDLARIPQSPDQRTPPR